MMCRQVVLLLRRSGICLIARMLVLAGATTTPAVGGTIKGVPAVVDGDGLRFGEVAIRMHGIDAPEISQQCASRSGGTWACGVAAADRLAALVAGASVDCEALDKDAYGRIIARCRAGGVDLGAMLVREGYAWAFRRYSVDYTGLEAEAQVAGQGIWQAPTMPAWEFRAGGWSESAEAAPGACPIKGNINAEGEHIYHMPWSPWYARTQVSERKGERWFCKEAEARAAGWRAARVR